MGFDLLGDNSSNRDAVISQTPKESSEVSKSDSTSSAPVFIHYMVYMGFCGYFSTEDNRSMEYGYS